ncbi:uncharacterized protein [Ambystoma mexicanum]|uniref:uncharacterized protein isoform X2 n=1 Tax=Ambystoma mexicanum TaxID=8296 RepID=UPI0037E87905
MSSNNPSKDNPEPLSGLQSLLRAGSRDDISTEDTRRPQTAADAQNVDPIETTSGTYQSTEQYTDSLQAFPYQPARNYQTPWRDLDYGTSEMPIERSSFPRHTHQQETMHGTDQMGVSQSVQGPIKDFPKQAALYHSQTLDKSGRVLFPLTTQSHDETALPSQSDQRWPTVRMPQALQITSKSLLSGMPQSYYENPDPPQDFKRQVTVYQPQEPDKSSHKRFPGPSQGLIRMTGSPQTFTRESNGSQSETRDRAGESQNFGRNVDPVLTFPRQKEAFHVHALRGPGGMLPGVGETEDLSQHFPKQSAREQRKTVDRKESQLVLGTLHSIDSSAGTSQVFPRQQQVYQSHALDKNMNIPGPESSHSVYANTNTLEALARQPVAHQSQAFDSTSSVLASESSASFDTNVDQPNGFPMLSLQRPSAVNRVSYRSDGTQIPVLSGSIHTLYDPKTPKSSWPFPRAGIKKDLEMPSRTGPVAPYARDQHSFTSAHSQSLRTTQGGSSREQSSLLREVAGEEERSLLTEENPSTSRAHWGVGRKRSDLLLSLLVKADASCEAQMGLFQNSEDSQGPGTARQGNTSESSELLISQWDVHPQVTGIQDRNKVRDARGGLSPTIYLLSLELKHGAILSAQDVILPGSLLDPSITEEELWHHLDNRQPFMTFIRL